MSALTNRTRRTNAAAPTGQGVEQIGGMYYPVVKATDYKGVKPDSAPDSFVLTITNDSTKDVLVPIFNTYHMNEKANEAFKAYLLSQDTSAEPAPVTDTKMIRTYDPENPIADVTIKAGNGKPLLGLLRELTDMPALVTGTIVTSEQQTVFNKSMTIAYDDWNDDSQTYNRRLNRFKDKYANDNSEIDTDIAFYIDGRLTLWLPVPKNGSVDYEFITKYHFNRIIFK